VTARLRLRRSVVHTCRARLYDCGVRSSRLLRRSAAASVVLFAVAAAACATQPEDRGGIFGDQPRTIPEDEDAGSEDAGRDARDASTALDTSTAADTANND